MALIAATFALAGALAATGATGGAAAPVALEVILALIAAVTAYILAAAAFANCLKRHNYNAEGDLILQKIEALQHEIDTIRRFAGI